MEKSQNRNIGIDVLRILSIVLITVIHYISYSDILDKDALLGGNKVLLLFFSALSTAAVNIFVLITGYFQSQKNVKIEKCFVLWAKILIISVLLLCFAFVLGLKISIANIIKCFFPISTAHYWFFVTYLLLLALSPMINLILKNLSKKVHCGVCVMAGIVICLLFVENPFVIADIYLGHFHGIVWFVYLYVVGAYFKKHNISISPKKSVPLLLLVLTVIFSLKYFSASVLIEGNNSFLPFVLSVLLFLVFKEINVTSRFWGNVVTRLSACSFFVYIIQEHCLIRAWYWDLWKIPLYADSPFLIINFIMAVLALWPVAYLYERFFALCLSGIIRKVYIKTESFVRKCFFVKKNQF